MVLLRNRHVFHLPFLQRVRVRFLHRYPRLILGFVFLVILIALLAFYPTSSRPPYLMVNTLSHESQRAVPGEIFQVNPAHPLPLPVTGGPADAVP